MKCIEDCKHSSWLNFVLYLVGQSRNMTWYVPNDAGTVWNAATTAWHLPHSATIPNFLEFQRWSFAVALARVSTSLTHHTNWSPNPPTILPTNLFSNQTSHYHYALVDIVFRIWLSIVVMVQNLFQEELSMLCTDTVHLSNNILWSIFFLMIALQSSPSILQQGTSSWNAGDEWHSTYPASTTERSGEIQSEKPDRTSRCTLHYQ